MSRRSTTTRRPGCDLVKDGQAQRLRVLQVTSDYFRTLRSSRLRGREFERRRREPAIRRVVLSDAAVARRASRAIRRSSARPSHLNARTVRGGGDRAAGLRRSDRRRAWMRGSPYALAATPSEENNSLERGRPAAAGRQPRTGASGACGAEPVDEARAGRRRARAPSSRCRCRRIWSRASRGPLQLVLDRRRPRAPGRVRERGQPRAGARDRPRPRVRDPRGAGLGPAPARPPAARREPAARRRSEVCSGSRSPGLASMSSRRLGRDAIPAARRRRLRRRRAGVFRAGDAGHGRRVRRRAGAALRPHPSEPRAAISNRARPPARAGRDGCEAASPPRSSRSR